ncbi:MAG: hypothetical protein IJD48_00505 [Clostridia bacterium]|nr:hypothetical protein [Clostridia bacterium]
MTKKRCKVKLVLVSILTLIGLFLTFFSFVIPTTNTTFRGFFNAVNYGYDVNGGQLSVYECNDDSIVGEELDNKLSHTVAKLNAAFNGMGLNVTKQGDQVRIEISNADMHDVSNLSTTYGVNILSMIGAEKGISFNGGDKYNDAGSITGEYIEKCTYSYQNQWVVNIEFTEEGKQLFKEMTGKLASETKPVKMYVNGEQYGSGFEISSAISSLTLTATNQQTAEALSLQISALAKPVNLSQISSDVISPGLNTSVKGFFGNQQTLMIVGVIVMFAGLVAFLCIRYRMLGLMGTMSLLIFVVLYSFLLQSIPLVLMDVNGIMGALATFVLLGAGMISIFERIRQEYAVGKKIPNSVRSGFKKTLMPVLEKYIFGALFAAVLFIVGTVGLKAFAVNVFVGLFVNYFVLFVVLRGLSNYYITINPTKKDAYNLNREARKNEI